MGFSPELMETLADLEHDRWSRWEKYRATASSAEAEARWMRQRDTPYVKLTEHEKDSDRAEVMRTLEVLKRFGIVG